MSPFDFLGVNSNNKYTITIINLINYVKFLIIKGQNSADDPLLENVEVIVDDNGEELLTINDLDYTGRNKTNWGEK